MPIVSPLDPLEPALQQIRELSAPDLDTLVGGWLRRKGLQAVRIVERARHRATYQALIGTYPFVVVTYVQVFQRRNRLQVHHLDALRGRLLRDRVPLGLLVTTGDLSREARRVASSDLSPRILVLSGPEWGAELRGRRPGLLSRKLAAFVLDLGRGLFQAPCKSQRPASPRRSR